MGYPKKSRRSGKVVVSGGSTVQTVLAFPFVFAFK